MKECKIHVDKKKSTEISNSNISRYLDFIDISKILIDILTKILISNNYSNFIKIFRET